MVDLFLEASADSENQHITHGMTNIIRVGLINDWNEGLYMWSACALGMVGGTGRKGRWGPNERGPRARKTPRIESQSKTTKGQVTASAMLVGTS